MAQIGDEIARRRKTEPHHFRVGRSIDQFVDRAGVEPLRPRDGDLVRGIERKREVGRHDARIGLVLTHRELRLRRTQIRHGIGQHCRRRAARVVEDEFLARQSGHLRHDGQRDRQAAISGGEIALPAAPDHRVTAVHQKAVAGIARLDQFNRARRIVEKRKRNLAATVHYVIEEPAVAVGGDGRAQDFHIGRGLDQPQRIARRALDVGDDGVVRIAGRDRHGDARENAVVGADIAEYAAFECRQLDAPISNLTTFAAAGAASPARPDTNATIVTNLRMAFPPR